MPVRAERLKGALLSTPLWGLAIAAATWPFSSLAPGAGLDPSWIAGLYMATERGLDAGTQIVFTYGPLGFLGFPTFYEIDLGRLAFAWSLLAHIVLCVSLLWAARRAFGFAAGILVATCAAVTPSPDPLLLAAAVVGAAAILGEWSARARMALVVVGGALAGMQLLGSLRAGPTLVAMGVAVLVGMPERRRTVPAFFGALLLSFAVFWLATGQGFGNLDDYVVNTADVVGGYSASMVFLQPGHWWQTPALLVALATLAILCADAVRDRDNWRRAGLVLLVLAVGFLMFKHAVVRESPGSFGLLFAALLAIGVALVPHARFGVALASIVVLLGVAYLGNRDLVGLRFELRQHAETLFEEAKLATLPGRAEDEQQRGREGMEAAYGIPPRQIAALRTGTVHVAPWEAGAAWAYDLDWDPLPVFQQYSAYTKRLDELNAAKLEGDSAPERILWQNTTMFDPNAVNYPGAIDARWPAFETPVEMVRMLCLYRATQWTENWAVLRRAPNRCGRERFLGSVVARNRESVPLPRTRPDEALVVRVEGLGISGLERLRTLFFRAKNRGVIFSDASWSIVGNTAEDGLLVSVPRWADYPGKFALSSGSSTIGFERFGGLLTGVDDSTKLTLRFYALPLRAPAILSR